MAQPPFLKVVNFKFMASGSSKETKPNNSPRRQKFAKRRIAWGWILGAWLGYVLMGFILSLFPTPNWTWFAIVGGAWAVSLTAGSIATAQLRWWWRLLIGFSALIGTIAIAIAISTAMNLAVEVRPEISEEILKGLIGDIALVTTLVVMGVGALTITMSEASDQLLKGFNRMGVALILIVTSSLGIGVGSIIGRLINLE